MFGTVPARVSMSKQRDIPVGPGTKAMLRGVVFPAPMKLSHVRKQLRRFAGSTATFDASVGYAT